jgi:hypothetical protein
MKEANTMKYENVKCVAGKDVLSCYGDGHDSPPLPTLARTLLESQKTSWPFLKTSYENLATIRTRRLKCDHSSLILQFNPARLISTAAAVDPITINNRKCFLCIENLPEAQRAIEYRGRYLILCNPYPIFPGHFTIAFLHHKPQAIETEFVHLLKLAEDFGPDYLVFYNGPQCGASAPDHMHFQASPRGIMPIEEEILQTGRQSCCKRIGHISLTRFRDLGREVLMLDGGTLAAMETVMNRLCNALRQMLNLSDEPMMNLFCSHSGSSWRLVIFLRRKHRPDAYFLENEGRLMISPGLVDMGGLIVTPREEDFDSLDCESARKILEEVSQDRNIVDDAISRL